MAPPSDLVHYHNPVEPGGPTIARVHDGDVHPRVTVEPCFDRLCRIAYPLCDAAKVASVAWAVSFGVGGLPHGAHLAKASDISQTLARFELGRARSNLCQLNLRYVRFLVMHFGREERSHSDLRGGTWYRVLFLWIDAKYDRPPRSDFTSIVVGDVHLCANHQLQRPNRSGRYVRCSRRTKVGVCHRVVQPLDVRETVRLGEVPVGTLGICVEHLAIGYTVVRQLSPLGFVQLMQLSFLLLAAISP